MEEHKNNTARLIIGTSGYSYPDWVGTFYPPNLSRKDFLKYYTTYFDGVELNYTYYSPPKAKTLEKMVNQTPRDFVFSVKAHKSFTHERKEITSSSVKDFLTQLQPLKESNKLAVVLLQFPYSFHYTKQNRYFLCKLLDNFREVPLAVEFRNKEWQRDSVIKELRDRDISYVNVDLPSLKNLPSPTGIITSHIGYLRFHGRNSDNWWSGNNVSRYDYRYTDEELNQWILPIKRMLSTSSLLLVFFNNHRNGKATQDAKKLKSLLRSAY